MENTVYIIELIGENVFGGRTISGYVNEYNETTIKNIVKKRHNLNIDKPFEPKYTWEIGIHWTYPTNMEGCDVHVTLIHQLD